MVTLGGKKICSLGYKGLKESVFWTYSNYIIISRVYIKQSLWLCTQLENKDQECRVLIGQDETALKILNETKGKVDQKIHHHMVGAIFETKHEQKMVTTIQRVSSWKYWATYPLPWAWKPFAW